MTITPTNPTTGATRRVIVTPIHGEIVTEVASNSLDDVAKATETHKAAVAAMTEALESSGAMPGFEIGSAKVVTRRTAPAAPKGEG